MKSPHCKIMWPIIILHIVSITAALEAKVIPTIQHLPIQFEEVILGGRHAQKGEFPFIVSLKAMMYDHQLQHFCGGTIVTHQVILTAAHCVQDIMWAVAGEHDLYHPEGTEQVRKVAHFKIHEEYVLRPDKANINDIAILYIEKPFVFNKYVTLIPLFKANENLTKGIATIAGWGYTTNRYIPSQILKTETVALLPPDACNETIINAKLSPHILSDSVICIGPLNNSGPCSGDSGSPMIVNGLLVGITSWVVVPCGTQGTPAGYTRISSFINWIVKSTQEVKMQHINKKFLKNHVNSNLDSFINEKTRNMAG